MFKNILLQLSEMIFRDDFF